MNRIQRTLFAMVLPFIAVGVPWPGQVNATTDDVETDHWSLQPIATVVPPNELASHPIDAFIIRQLRQRGLGLSEPANPAALVRRVHLDLIGLPSSPEQVDQVINHPDGFDAGYERLIDQLLQSPRYGERWAQHWLDVVRYADTHGFEVNTPRDNAWPYRDYVISAFNEDKPYDQFILEQLAGDAVGENAATGFLVSAAALLPGQIGKDEPSIKLARQDELHEVVENVGSAFLGLTVGCARCHDHMFDPITQRDYYAMQAVFAGVQYGEQPWRQSRSDKADPPMVFAGVFTDPAPTYLLDRGDPMQPSEAVEPDALSVIGSLGLTGDSSDPERRLALAKWLTVEARPLVARVMVNRIWQHHFGTGIVATANDFGYMGGAPTHPELLDWLAAEFVRGGWSLKHMHRLILISNTYRQSSRIEPSALAIDQQCRLLWRFPSRRLEAEAIRDSLLQVAGTLDQEMGGPGFSLFEPNDNYVRVYIPKEEFTPHEWRRMIYAHKVRRELDGVFGAFDQPDAGRTCAQRQRSTTPIQALNLFNSGFVMRQAEHLAGRIRREVGDDPAAQVVRGFALLFVRRPSDEELHRGRSLVEKHGLESFCRSIVNASEFVFLP